MRKIAPLEEIKMAKDEKLRQEIRNLYDELQRRELPYFVTDKILRLMQDNNIEPYKRGNKNGTNRRYS